MDEKRIVRLCKNGRREYFEQLVSYYEKPLYRYCFHLCSNRDSAMDLFQETWLRAVSKINRYDEKYPFKSWVFTIATNIFRDSYRKKMRRSRLNAVFSNGDEMEAVLEQVKSNEKPADVRLEENEMRSMIKSEVSLLKWKHRSVVVLHYFEDVPVKDISIILDIPVGTVKSRLAYARNILRERMEGSYE